MLFCDTINDVKFSCVVKCQLQCLLIDDNDENCEINSDSAFGIYRALYEKPTPLHCIEPLYKLNEDGSVPGQICQLFTE